MDGIITKTVNVYIHTFNSYFSQFLQWGQNFFFIGIIITIVWLCLWNAFDKKSFQDSMPEFIKEFFVIALFYTIMIYAKDWLISIPNTAAMMGQTLSGLKVDPSSIIDQGISITNFLSSHINASGIMEKFYTAIMIAVANVIILFSFISVALELAVTLLIIYFFIAISGFALAFSVFPFTRSIARRTLDVVIANSMKLVSLYVVIAAGRGIFTAIINDLTNTPNLLNVLGWIVAAALMFWLVCRNIPSQVARVFSDAVQETRGTSAAALALSTIANARMIMSTIGSKGHRGGGSKSTQPKDGVTAGISKIVGTTIGNATAHFNCARSSGSGITQSVGKAIGGTSQNTLCSVGESLADRFKHLSNKLKGGPGIVKSTKDLPSFAERMYDKTAAVANKPFGLGEDVNSDNSHLGASGVPNSAGRKAAALNSTRSIPRASKTKPK